MSVDTLPEKTGFSGRSPRISFSHELVLSSRDKHATSPPVQKPSTDFDFGTSSHGHESTTADELFSNGKLIPLRNVVRKPTLKSEKSIDASQSSPRSLGKEGMAEDSGKMIITNDEIDDKQASKSFWKVMRSRSFGGSGRSLCPLPLLSRSNSTGSPLDSNKLPNPQKSNVAAPPSPKLIQKPRLKKSASGNNVVSVGAALFLFQQLAGINAVVYYSTSVFRSAGIASDVAASALVGAANVFGTAVASSLMDKQGRKSLLLISFSGMAAMMLLLSLTFTWNVLTPYAGPLAVAGTVLYVLSFSLGAGPVPGLLLPEIFASRIRAKAVSLSFGMHWISNFVIGLCFLSVVDKFGISSVYLGFSAVCFLAVLYIASNVVETKGRSLEEIELALSTTA